MRPEEAEAFIVAHKDAVDAAQIAVLCVRAGKHFLILGLEGRWAEILLPDEVGEVIGKGTLMLDDAVSSERYAGTLAQVRADVERLVAERPNGTFEGWKPPA